MRQARCFLKLREIQQKKKKFKKCKVIIKTHKLIILNKWKIILILMKMNIEPSGTILDLIFFCLNRWAQHSHFRLAIRQLKILEWSKDIILKINLFTVLIFCFHFVQFLKILFFFNYYFNFSK